MIDNNQEGPTIIPEQTIIIPERKSCFDCKYFVRDLRCHSMMGGSEHESSCKHPNAWPEDSALAGDVRQIGRPGSFGGGDDDNTPDWCPFLREDNE